jgi:hypothetical protein
VCLLIREFTTGQLNKICVCERERERERETDRQRDRQKEGGREDEKYGLDREL